MGLGGIIVLLLVLGIGVYILVTEKPFSKREAGNKEDSDLPKPPVILAPAPPGMVEALTPPWQKELHSKLQDEGFRYVGDFSYAALNFFWARTFLSPDSKSALLLVNWVEGKEGGKVVIPNLELYSFDGNSFLLTACSQDGAARLLTGAKRPTEEQLSLHLKAVYSESAVRPIVEEHRQRLAAWEARGAQIRILTPTNILPSLSKIYS
jgi:hypothetical protein